MAMCGQLEFQNNTIPLFVSNFGAQILKKMNVPSIFSLFQKKMFKLLLQSKYDDENTIVSNK